MSTTEEFARRQISLQEQIVELLKKIRDPNERYNVLCNYKADFQLLTEAIGNFESSRDVTTIENLFSTLAIR